MQIFLSSSIGIGIGCYKEMRIVKDFSVAMETYFVLFLVFGCHALPVVDKGVFVITGVKSCGSSVGYCILGGDCTVDKEFIPDEGGHCDGLRKAFTPRAFFVCCKLEGGKNVTTIPPTTTITSTISLETSSSVEDSAADSNSNSVEDVITTESVTETMETWTESSTTEKVVTTEKVATTTEAGETVVETNVHTHYSSCLDNRLRGDRLAAKSTTQQICWTGALTRSPSSQNATKEKTFSDPGTFLCSGALISPTVLVTTATCVSRLFGQDLKQFKVVLGSRRLIHPSSGPSDGTYRSVEELVIHEEYGVYGGVVRVNDVAIVKLSSPTANESYCTVCLADDLKASKTSGTCVVSGFSHPTSSGVIVGEPSDLHEAEQQIEDSEICSGALGNYSKNTIIARNDLTSDGLICASGIEKAEACFSPRDAGSPLACPHEEGGYRLVGLFSSGFHCGTRQMPVLYTNIGSGKLLRWVRRFLEE